MRGKTGKQITYY